MNGHTCPQCHQPVSSTANFCGHCRAPLKPKASRPEIAGGNRWGRQPGEFAARIETTDLKALLGKGLVVEEGTIGLLFQDGRMVGTLTPGSHTLETVAQRLKNVVVAQPCAVLLVDVGDSLLQVECGQLRTSDDQLVGARLQMVVGLQKPLDFFVNFMKSQRLVMVDDLAERIRQLVVAALQPLVVDCRADELYGNRELAERVELDLRAALAHRFDRMGLVFDRVEFVDFLGEFDAKVRRQRGELHREQALADVDQQRRKLHERLASERAQEELRKLKGEAAFKQYVQRLEHEVFRRDLLRKQERDEIWRSYNERAEDHEKARKHMLATVDWQRRRELARLEHEATVERLGDEHERNLQSHRNQGELSHEEQQQRIVREQAELAAAIEREQTAFQHRLKQERATFDERLRRDGDQFEQGQQQKAAAARTDLEIAKDRQTHELETLEKLVGIKDKYAREKQQRIHDDRRFQQELEEQTAAGRHQRELERLDKFGDLPIPALIAASEPEQAAMLADLQKTETLRSMNAEQILALWAEGSPEIAQAFAEKFKSAGQQQAGDEARELYERMLAEKDRTTETIQATHREHLQAFQDLVQTALQTQRDTSVATHNPPAGVVVQTGGASAVANRRFCNTCGNPVAVAERFCSSCGATV